MHDLISRFPERAIRIFEWLARFWVALALFVEVVTRVLGLFQTSGEAKGRIYAFLQPFLDQITYGVILALLVLLLLSWRQAGASRKIAESIATSRAKLAQMVSENDWIVFDMLFEKRNGSNDRLREQINSAKSLICNNLQESLNHAQMIVSASIGAECAVCIQVLEPLTGRGIEDAVITTILRDRQSFDRNEKCKPKNGVSGSGPGHFVRDNSPNQQIFVENADCVLENDLSKAAAEGRFKTTSQNYPEKYNAIMVVPIPYLIPNAAAGGSVRPVISGVTRNTLCFDTKSGKFSKEYHVPLANEFACQMGIMLHKIDRLHAALERLGAHSV